MARAGCLHPNPQRYRGYRCHECLKAWRSRNYRKHNGFQVFWDRQHGLCAFCGQPLLDDNSTHLDHNHRTDIRRGLVHAACNQMIGGIENAIQLVGSAAQVLRYFDH